MSIVTVLPEYLDFDSHHPLAHKIAVAHTLLTKADRISVSMPDRDAEKRHITQALYSNGYPTRVIKRNWQTPPAHSPASDPVTPRATVVIPYVRHVSESIRRILTLLEIQDLFSPTSHPTANIGEPEGPHPTTTTGRCGLQDPLWHMSQGVCWPDLSDAGSSAERTQESTHKRKPGPVCSCRACSS